MATATAAPSPPGAPDPDDATAEQQLAPPPKLRRRPIWIIAGVALVCLGALGSVWAYNSATNAHEVLAVRQTVERGQTITRQDLMTVRIAVDPALQPLGADQADTVIGKRAALDMAAGGVVTADQVADLVIPPKGSSVVGISVTAGMQPADELQVGDPVRLITTPGQQGEIAAGNPEAFAATVVGLAADQATGASVVNVQVRAADAGKVAARAATGKVAIVLDSRAR